jgi:hypothetical protein
MIGSMTTRSSPNFHYFALHYLNLWISQDRDCCKAMEGSDRQRKLQLLSKAAVAYKIARNLHTRHDVERRLPRLSPVLDIIDHLDRRAFRGSKLVPAVEKIRAKISDRYGGRGLLSATTKFLWLKLQSPIIIYDSQARRALRVDPDDLEGYCIEWRRRYEQHAAQIADACLALPRASRFTKNPKMTSPEYIANTARHTWFRERVFDVYLWHVGAKNKDLDL